MNSYRSSSSNAGKIVALQELLQERFPEAQTRLARHQGAEEENPGSGACLGVRCVDEAGGVGQGEVTEVVGLPGGGVVVHRTLEAAAAGGHHVALVDGRDTFDPQFPGGALCRRLLWVRCRTALEAVKAADLLLRDGNLPLVVVDLQFNPDRELKRVPGNTWFRLRSLAAATGAALLVLTPCPLVGCADLRVVLEPGFSVASLDQPLHELAASLRGRVVRCARNRGLQIKKVG